MQTTPPASLLVAALVMLRHPCPRNQAAAQLLLERAAEHDSLTHAERDACRTLADDLDTECAGTPPVRAKSVAARPALTGKEYRQNRAAALAFPNEMA